MILSAALAARLATIMASSAATAINLDIAPPSSRPPVGRCASLADLGGRQKPQWYPISARTLPRNTQYDQPVYIRITGSRNSVPTAKKACVSGDEAACH